MLGWSYGFVILQSRFSFSHEEVFETGFALEIVVAQDIVGHFELVPD